MKAKKSAIIYLLIAAFVFASSSFNSEILYADVAVPETINIGLSFGQSQANLFTLGSETGMSLLVHEKGSYKNLLDMTGPNYIKVRRDEYYNIINGKENEINYVRAAKYSSMDKSEYFKYANENTLVIIHIEGMEGIENLDKILEVDGIDVIFIGPYDLSQSLGIPGDVNNIKVEEKMKEVVNKASAKGKIVGTFVDDIESAKKWKSLGIQYMSYAVDVGIIYDSFKKITEGFK